jgi:anhydro-N-acetylmuramic acid kinase
MKVIGVMSGTSLDGVDLAYVEFTEENSQFEFSLEASETIPYTAEWMKKLKESMSLNAESFCKLNVDYGHFLGKLVNDFIKKNNLSVDLIASHGHTIFHQPQNKFTVQIGDGASIHAETRLPVVNDFRSLDVALEGQGAPLVPIGDQLLFSEYSYCLNLGGIANISYQDKNQARKAFDICPVNMILNSLSEEVGLTYDKDGQLAEKGNLIDQLFNQLNRLEYYKLSSPKSLGYEWFVKMFQPLVKSSPISVEDKLNTVCHHIAFQIGTTISSDDKNSKILVTGGGAKNLFLVSLLRKYCTSEIVIPDEKIIDFKEAMIFALLGYLRIHSKTNVLSSVTGAKNNSISGALHGSL